ncbi:nitrous oxide reductase accessory protein NosL [Methylomonas montana]|uniref:nitrous oxide reductase accessory protein NosL n=1 Tax=Methylomonas montana TaxID=3058963 RepID=UPI002659A2D2|nr:nitrous oxide reductase accessory protein NosL [Methylomonas montana]WKJ92148.1 nitrous oxide reductase accessory protein NosL [Methylomonas montana]
MKTMKTLWMVLLCQLLLPGWAWADDPSMKPVIVTPHEKQQRPSCRVCGMWIDQYIKTAGVITYKDDSQEYTCGVACLLREVTDAGGISELKSAKVTDWVSGELVDADAATYVVGSKVIPDMLPNYIAFAERDEAVAFAAKEGGEVIDFNIAFQDSSPVGTTAPFRIRTAVTPGEGNFSVGMVYGYMQKDHVKDGSNGAEPGEFIAGNGNQLQAPNESQVMQQALIFNYSPTDSLALFMNMPWFEKRAHTLSRSTANAAVRDTVSAENGLGDISLEGRYNFWHSTRYDQFASVLLGTSLPTGEFNGQRNANRVLVTSAGLQQGKGTATFTGGLLYSQRWKDIWLHASALYNANPENDDHYKYGDVVTGGLALHYTPNYDLMLGIEIDSNYTQKSEDLGNKVANSGGLATNLAFVGDYRFLNAFGGNFKLRGSVGLPIYEDLNSFRIALPGNNYRTQVQPGEGFFGNIAIQWTFRDAPDYHNH